MLYRLVVEKNRKRVRVVELRSPSARVGRAHGNEVRIPSADVSRRHCRLVEDDGVLWVEDLESVNGTYLNGDLITGMAAVRPGDRLQVGPVTFVVEYELTPNALERLRELDSEPPDVSDAAEVVHAEEAEVEEAEEVMDVEAGEEEVVEAEEYIPRADLDEVTWAPPQEGDLRDMLAHLDEGQESMLPRKRPGPRPRKDQDEEDDWPADRRSGLTESEEPKGKRRPKRRG
jgi:predicted component of type VI protein secretion system